MDSPTPRLVRLVGVLAVVIAVAAGLAIWGTPSDQPGAPAAGLAGLSPAGSGPAADPAPVSGAGSDGAGGLIVPAGDGGTLPDPTSCLSGGDHHPAGTVSVVPGGRSLPGEAAVRYVVEIEDGLAVDAACFAEQVVRILADPRSWGADGRVIMQRVDSGPVDFRVTLAGPALTDAECAPLETSGIYSCWSGDRAMINVWRWEHGTEDYAGDLATYREYLINHEVGHALGHGHVGCPAAGEPAPVMAQQTKGLDGCLKNGWPLAEER